MKFNLSSIYRAGNKVSMHFGKSVPSQMIKKNVFDLKLLRKKVL